MKPPDLPPSLVEDLISGDDDRAEQAALHISSYGEAAIHWLRPLQNDPQPDHRWWLARTLSRIRSAASTRILIQLLADANADVRACAVYALGEAHADGAVDHIAELLNDSSVYVSAMAADTLARIGRASVPILIERLKHGTPLEHARSAKALLAILDPSSIPALIAALDDDSPVVEHYASEALTRLGVGTLLVKPQ